MSGRGDKENKRPLDTTHMQEKLKGDFFPQNWEEFLDDDIRSFFDALLNETGQKKKRDHKKGKSFPFLRLSADGGGAGGESGIIIC